MPCPCCFQVAGGRHHHHTDEQEPERPGLGAQELPHRLRGGRLDCVWLFVHHDPGHSIGEGLRGGGMCMPHPAPLNPATPIPQPTLIE